MGFRTYTKSLLSINKVRDVYADKFALCPEFIKTIPLVELANGMVALDSLCC